MAQTTGEEWASWNARETMLSRLSLAEKQARLGLLPPDRPAVAPSLAAPMVAPLAALPASFDWRSKDGGDYVTNVRNQGDCGGCWAFAAAAALESKVLIGEGTPGVSLNLSEQVILSCSGAGTCAGGYLDTAAQFVRDEGTALESCYPYNETNGFCGAACADWQDSAFRVKGFAEDYYYDPSLYDKYGNRVPNDPNRDSRKDLLKNLVFNKGPVMVAFTVYNDFYDYHSGVYRKTAGASRVGYHAVTVVGWKETSDPWGGYFIVKNSWGSSDWGVGEGGFFKIAYDQHTSGQSGPNFGWWIVSLGDAYRTQPLADLKCGPENILVASGAPVLAGDPFSVEGRVQNAGSADAPPTTARLFLSPKDDTNLADDTDLGTVDVAGLAAGADTLVQWDNLLAPAPAGATPMKFWPVIRVDDGGVVTESSEGNNLGKSSTAFLSVEPPAWVQVLTPNGGKALYRGKTYAFTWGSSNCGTVTVQLLKRVSGKWLVKKTLATGLDATLGTVSWKVGKYFPTGSYYKARVTCDQDGSLLDESDARFSIKSP